jgi:predicted nucleic acid-binding protein
MLNVLLDTSFCIRLLKKDDPLHQNAIEYFEYFLDQKTELFISTIAIAEYSVKDDPANLPLKMMKIIPFDFFDGKTAGEFHSILIEQKDKTQNIDRNIVKDDCKLIAQLYNRKIEGYITKDRKSFSQIIKPITEFKGFSISLIDFSIPLKQFKGELF